MTLAVHWMATRLLPEAALLQDINPTVRTDLRMHNHRMLVQQAPLFRLIRYVRRLPTMLSSIRVSAAATREVVARLQPAWYAPGDAVFTTGCIAAEMFFIHAGTVCLRAPGPVVAEDAKGAQRGRLQRLTDRLAKPVGAEEFAAGKGALPQQVLLGEGAHFGEGALLRVRMNVSIGYATETCVITSDRVQGTCGRLMRWP